MLSNKDLKSTVILSFENKIKFHFLPKKLMTFLIFQDVHVWQAMLKSAFTDLNIHCFINNEYKLHIDLPFCKPKLYSKPILCKKQEKESTLFKSSILEDECIYFFYNVFDVMEILTWN